MMGLFLSRGALESTGMDPLAWALEGQKRGAGEILLTSIDRDGTKRGLDNLMIRKASESLNIPVIAAGGYGISSDFIAGFTDGKADAISSGNLFLF